MLTINDVMHLSWRLACVIGLLVIPIAGCSDLGDEPGAGAMGGSLGIGGTPGTGGTGGPTSVTLLLTTTELGEGNPTLEGVRVCEADTDNCVMSNQSGRAALDLPANQEIAYTLEKEGYGQYVAGDVTDDTFGNTTPGSAAPVWLLFTDDQQAAMAVELETVYPWTGGFLVLRALPTRAGATCEIDSETAKPFYFDEAGVPSLDLTATTSQGDCGFVDVTPGIHEIEFGGTATNCVASIAWPTDVANVIKVPVRDGYGTYGSMGCDPLE